MLIFLKCQISPEFKPLREHFLALLGNGKYFYFKTLLWQAIISKGNSIHGYSPYLDKVDIPDTDEILKIVSSWSFDTRVMKVRTEKGEKIINGAVKAGMLRTRAVDEEPFALTLLTKLSKKKRKNSPRS